MIVLLSTILLVLATAASAQQTTYRNANGQITGTVSTDSNGQRTFRDGSGRMTGTANTDSNGTTTFRDAGGRTTGTATARRDAERRSRMSRTSGSSLAAADPARGGHPALPHWLQTRAERLSKVQSVDQRMRLECGVGFHQLRTYRRARPGQLCANCCREQLHQNPRQQDRITAESRDGLRCICSCRFLRTMSAEASA